MNSLSEPAQLLTRSLNTLALLPTKLLNAAAQLFPPAPHFPPREDFHSPELLSFT